jgi:tetraacyldisaccharide-1-P 4'-kinase
VNENERVRVDVGFVGGLVVGGNVDTESADALERALHEDGPRVVVLELEDGRYHIVVSRVTYFRRSNRASRLGFGSG